MSIGCSSRSIVLDLTFLKNAIIYQGKWNVGRSRVKSELRFEQYVYLSE